jgi:ABC-2 type transport system ATP-binding protein
VTVIEVAGLTKRYGDSVAVDGVSFAADAGRVVALLGPNGAGKTTTVEILAGFRRPDGGSVRVLGVDPWRSSRSWRARIGLVLQSTSLDRVLTVAEVIAAYSSVYPRALKSAELLDRVDLTDEANSRIGALSGGQRRRVDLALGIVGRPELLFLDEPTTGLDPHARRRVWTVVRELVAAGATVLLTTHYLEEAQELADRVIVIDHGRIVADATPDELRARNAAVMRIPAVNGIPVPRGFTEIDGELVLHTTDVATDLAALVDWAHRHSVDLAALQVGPPSLEEAYLALTADE